ncbi:MAG: hypothetical protein PHO56_02885 [Patescibacteria group bacterium]|nr:hypothetical protein [Patescibacteria group bacterium]
MNNLLTAQFWFNQSPDSLIPAMQNLLLAIIAFFLAAAVACFFLKKRQGFYKPFWNKLSIFFISNFIIGALLDFFSLELVPFLSARIWFALWVIGMVVWIVFIVIYAKRLPDKKRQFIAEQNYKKYIP